MDYISFQWHIGVSQLSTEGCSERKAKRLHKIPNGRAAVRESASSGRDTGCQEQPNPAWMLSLFPGCWQASLSVSAPRSVLVLSVCPGRPPTPSPSPGSPSGCRRGAGKHMCQLSKRKSQRPLGLNSSSGLRLRRGKISSRCRCSSGRVCLLWLSSPETSGRLYARECVASYNFPHPPLPPPWTPTCSLMDTPYAKEWKAIGLLVLSMTAECVHKSGNHWLVTEVTSWLRG